MPRIYLEAYDRQHDSLKKKLRGLEGDANDADDDDDFIEVVDAPKTTGCHPIQSSPSQLKHVSQQYPPRKSSSSRNVIEILD